MAQDAGRNTHKRLGLLRLVCLVMGGALMCVVVLRLLGGMYHVATEETRSALRRGETVPVIALEDAAQRLENAAFFWQWDMRVWDDLGVHQFELARHNEGPPAARVLWLSKAEGSFLELTERAPFYAPGWSRLALVYERQGRVDDSVAAMLQSYAVGPLHPWAARMRLAWGSRNWAALDEELRRYVLRTALILTNSDENKAFAYQWIGRGGSDMAVRFVLFQRQMQSK